MERIEEDEKEELRYAKYQLNTSHLNGERVKWTKKENLYVKKLLYLRGKFINIMMSVK